MSATLGLCALARIIDEERVDEGHIADRGVRGTRRGQSRMLARQPFHRSVFAEVNDGVCAEFVFEPSVCGEIVMRRRHVRIVINRDRVLAESAWRLDQDDDVAGPQRGEHDLVLPTIRRGVDALPIVVIADAIHEQLPGRFAPRLRHGVGEFGRQMGNPFAICRSRNTDGAFGELRVGEPLFVLTAGGDKCVDQGIARSGVGIFAFDRCKRFESWDLTLLTHVIAVVTHRTQQPDRRNGGVEADRIADAAVFGRIGRQHDRDFALRGRGVAQTGVCDGDTGDARTALDIRDIAGQPVLVEFLERERRCDDAAVELGDRDLVGRVQRREAIV